MDHPAALDPIPAGFTLYEGDNIPYGAKYLWLIDGARARRDEWESAYHLLEGTARLSQVYDSGEKYERYVCIPIIPIPDRVLLGQKRMAELKAEFPDAEFEYGLNWTIRVTRVFHVPEK